MRAHIIYNHACIDEAKHSVNKLKLTPQEFKNNAHKV